MRDIPEFMSVPYVFKDGPGQIRCALAGGQLIFVASDIARWLGYSQSSASGVSGKWPCLTYVRGVRGATAWGVVTEEGVRILITYGAKLKPDQKARKLSEFEVVALGCKSMILVGTPE
jgi:prophage antirepressor-like protein